MIKIIFIKELQSYLLNKSILLTWALIIGLFTLNAFVFVFQFEDLKKKHENIALRNDQNLANTLPDMVTLTQKISNPPSSLMFLSGTSEGLVPDGVDMKLFEEPEFSNFIHFNPYLNPYFSIDWATVIIYIISFFCICFSYNAFSGEKEDGTLKLMLANSIPQLTIIISKFAGLLVIFTIPLLIGNIISCLIFELSPAIKMESIEYAKIAYFFLASILLIGTTILTGFLVSVLTQKSYTSLIICLVCWAMMVIIIPNVNWYIIRRTEKIPPETSIYQEEERQIDDLKDCYDGWQMINGIVPDKVALDRKHCNDRKTNVHNSLWSNYHNMQFAQTHKAATISKISPFGLFRFFSDKISENNYHGYISFFDQVKHYQLTFKEYVFSKDNADPNSQHLIWNEELCKSLMSQQKVNYSEIPKFTKKPVLFHQVIAGSISDIFILCLWMIVLFIATFIAFTKYDVR
jgi:ABC-type transport system involved in multi-copper enzyme maturation permease subunit